MADIHGNIVPNNKIKELRKDFEKMIDNRESRNKMNREDYKNMAVILFVWLRQNHPELCTPDTVFRIRKNLWKELFEGCSPMWKPSITSQVLDEETTEENGTTELPF